MSRCGEQSRYTNCYLQERDYLGNALKVYGVGDFLDRNQYSFLIKDERTVQRFFTISPGEYMFMNSRYDPESAFWPDTILSPYPFYEIYTHPTKKALSLELKHYFSYYAFGPPELPLEKDKDTILKFITVISSNPPNEKSFRNKLRKEINEIIESKSYEKNNILLKLINHSISASLEEWIMEFIGERILWKNGYITIREVMRGKAPDMIAIKVKGLKEGFGLSESMFRYFPSIFDFNLLDDMEIEDAIAIEIEPENRILSGIDQAISYYQNFVDVVSSAAVITNDPLRLGRSEEVDIWSIPAYRDLDGSDLTKFQKSKGSLHSELTDFAREFWKDNIIWSIRRGLEISLKI